MTMDEVQEGLKLCGGEGTTSQIAKRMNLSRNVVLRGLRGLEIRGLVERKDNPNGVGLLWKLK